MSNNILKKISFLSAVSILSLLVGCAGLQRDPALSDAPSGCAKQTASALLEQQNQLGSLTDTHTLICAVSVLQRTQDLVLSGSTLGSRLSLHLAEREPDQDKRQKFAVEGVEFAETALTQGGQNDGAVHYYLAANLGLAIRDHITLALGNLDRLESEMKHAVALSPDIDDGGPLRLLGALYLKAPAWPNGIGDLDKALDLLKTAVTKHPNHPLNHLFYAQALWAEDGDSNVNQVKSEFNLGEKLLAEGNWGYNKLPWKKEFAEFGQEFEGIVSSSK